MRCSWCSDLLSSSVSFRHSSLAPVTSCWACSKRCLFPFSSNPSFSICLENYRTKESIFRKYKKIHFKTKKKKKVIKVSENNAHFWFEQKYLLDKNCKTNQLKYLKLHSYEKPKYVSYLSTLIYKQCYCVHGV